MLLYSSARYCTNNIIIQFESKYSVRLLAYYEGIFSADKDLLGRNVLDLHVSIDATIKTLTSYDIAKNIYDITVSIDGKF